jgi:hypothetical protein
MSGPAQCAPTCTKVGRAHGAAHAGHGVLLGHSCLDQNANIFDYAEGYTHQIIAACLPSTCHAEALTHPVSQLRPPGLQ